jgi:Family of unknown function (DUF6155)
MASKLTLSELKKRLSTKTNAELIEEIVQLYNKFPVVKESLQSSLCDDETETLKKYKDIIKKEFIGRGNRFPGMRLSVARKAVTEFKKISRSTHNIADLMISYVEAGVHCTLEYGDIDSSFYNSMESMYETALKHVVKEDLFSEFEDRLQAIVDNTSGMGWGFHDGLGDLFTQYEAKTEKLYIV